MTGAGSIAPRRGRLIAPALAAILAALGLVLLLWPRPPSPPAPPGAAPEDGLSEIEADVARLAEENRLLRAELQGRPGAGRKERPPILAPEVESREGAASTGTCGLLVRVVRPDRSPVFGVEVAFSRRSGEPPFPETEHRAALTGEDGTAEFADLAPGSGQVCVSRPDRQRQIEVSLDPGRTLLLTVPLQGGVLVEGRVLRAAAAPAADMKVRFSRRGGGLTSFFARTGADGSYRMEGVPPGRYAVGVSGPGYRKPIQVSGKERTVMVPDVPRVVRDIYIEVPSIHGRFTDAATGMPVPDVAVLVGELGLVRAKSDAGGAFVLEDLLPGVTILRFRRPGYADHAARVETTGEPTGTALNVTLRPEVTVLLLVVDGTGAPYTGRLTAHWGLQLSTSSSISVGQSFATDEAGRARLGHLSEGTWRLFFRTESAGGAEVTVDLHRGENQVPVRLE